MNQIVILGKNNAKELADIHSLAFPHFFLTALGRNVLRIFYTSLLKEESTIAFGIKNEQFIVGFFVASISPQGLYVRIFRKNFFSFFIPLVNSFLKNFSLLKQMIVSFTSTKLHQVPKSCTASLLSICVRPDNAGIGVGKALLIKLESELRFRSQKGYYLTTDAENNDQTNQFYQKRDFKLHSILFQGDRKMNLYIKMFS